MATRSRTGVPKPQGVGPIKYRSFAEDEAFHLPIPGLFVDLDSGTGSIALTDEFSAAVPKVQVRVLQQWIRALAVERETALVKMFRAFSEPLSGETIVSQIERFRRQCAQEDIQCPDELPVLLQRY